jgi:hypothetical protein
MLESDRQRLTILIGLCQSQSANASLPRPRNMHLSFGPIVLYLEQDLKSEWEA